jgi:hypothetical protein
MNARMAEKMQLWRAYGHACAPDFTTEDFFKQRKEYEGCAACFAISSMKTGDWGLFEITR